jgi:hypothetical protein
MSTSFRSRQILLLYIFTIFTMVISSCSSDDNDPENPNAFWENAKLNDFPLNEVAHLDIDISHPEISNGVETRRGEIHITIPFSQQSLTLSLKQFGLDQSKYSISPAVGVPQNFSEGAVTYTIADVLSSERSVHYDVTIIHGGDPFFVNAEVTDFRFEKEKNPSLTNTIEALKISEYESYSENAIYVIVPLGTDFAGLKPTITYDAAKLYYSVGGEFMVYPESGLTVDFKYPKRFQLKAENSNGTKSKPYTVIVDVANPLQFDSPVVTDNVKAGNGLIEDFFGIATWTNQGNHPITGMSPTEYKDKTYPIPDYTGEANVITATLTNPNSGTTGLLPGQSGQINVRVKRTLFTGLYSTTAVFTPTFDFETQTISYWPVDDRVEGIFLPESLVVETTIEE